MKKPNPDRLEADATPTIPLTIVGPPRFKMILPDPDWECPACGCVTLAQIECDIQAPVLQNGKGIGRYLSCVACAWNGPLAVIERIKPTQVS